jgi:hypothetical protein
VYREDLERVFEGVEGGNKEVYMKLIGTTKDTRISHLLHQTDSHSDSLAQAVVVQ